MIEDQAENDWVEDLTIFYGGGDYWLGLTDQGSEDNWYWYDGTPFVYENWANNEPNNVGFWGEDCAVMWAGGTWNDAVCWAENGMVCEAP